jgi:hypothetical protein
VRMFMWAGWSPSSHHRGSKRSSAMTAAGGVTSIARACGREGPSHDRSRARRSGTRTCQHAIAGGNRVANCRVPALR